MTILDNSDWLPDSARLFRDPDLLPVDMSGFIPIGNHTQTTSFSFDRQIRFGVKGTRQPVPSLGAVHWDWTVTPTDGSSLDWNGERIYGVVRYEAITKSTPAGIRRFEIAFVDPPPPPPPPPSSRRRVLLYDQDKRRILLGPYIVAAMSWAVDHEVARLRAMSWEAFRDFARKSERRHYLLE